MSLTIQYSPPGHQFTLYQGYTPFHVSPLFVPTPPWALSWGPGTLVYLLHKYLFTIGRWQIAVDGSQINLIKVLLECLHRVQAFYLHMLKLTPVVLNISQETSQYICNFYHFSTLRCHRYFRSSHMEDKGLLILHMQFHGHWCSSD